MSILGKVLAALNVLAAIAVIYFAAADWGQRHNWAYNYFRMELALDGLPLDENQTDAEGVKVVTKITDKTLGDIFSADAPKAKTQSEAATQFKEKLLAEIGGLKEDEKENALRAKFMPLART